MSSFKKFKNRLHVACPPNRFSASWERQSGGRTPWSLFFSNFLKIQILNFEKNLKKKYQSVVYDLFYHCIKFYDQNTL
jgi:hypothetical protein